MTIVAKHLGGEIQRTINGWRWTDAMCRWRARDVLHKSQLFGHLPRAGRLLDLGSGLGHIAEAVLRDAPGRSCVMMDPANSVSPHVIRRIASHAYHSIRGSGVHLPFADSAFDGVWAAFVLHHMLFDGQEVVLDEIKRVIAPGGTFVLIEDTPRDAREARTTLLADRRTNFEPDAAPHHYRSPAEWQCDLSRHGFLVEQELAFTRVFPAVTMRAVQHRAFVCRRP